MPETRRVIERGRYYEDFKVGDVYRHHWGRTLTDGEAQLFATATMNAVPLYFNKLHAQALGHEAPPVHPLLVMNVVFGMTVEDLSEQALARAPPWRPSRSPAPACRASSPPPTTRPSPSPPSCRRARRCACSRWSPTRPRWRRRPIRWEAASSSRRSPTRWSAPSAR